MHPSHPLTEGRQSTLSAILAPTKAPSRAIAQAERPEASFGAFFNAEVPKPEGAAAGLTLQEQAAPAKERTVVPDPPGPARPPSATGHDPAAPSLPSISSSEDPVPHQDPARPAPGQSSNGDDTPATALSGTLSRAPEVTHDRPVGSLRDVAADAGQTGATAPDLHVRPRLPAPTRSDNRPGHDGPARAGAVPAIGTQSSVATLRQKTGLRETTTQPGQAQTIGAMNRSTSVSHPQSATTVSNQARPGTAIQTLTSGSIKIGPVAGHDEKAAPPMRENPPARIGPPLLVLPQVVAAGPTPVPPVPPVATAQMVGLAPQDPSPDLATGDLESEAQIVFETRTGSGQVQPPHASHTALRADLPQQIAMQIAAAAGRAAPGADRLIDLTLSPEELGSVRLSLRQTDDGLSVAIFAERPETLDLLRRNIDLLARDFLDIGYQSANFTFDRENPGTGERPDTTMTAPRIGPSSDADRSPPPATAIHLGDRLDIRL